MSDDKGGYLAWFARERASDHPLMTMVMHPSNESAAEKLISQFTKFKFFETYSSPTSSSGAGAAAATNREQESRGPSEKVSGSDSEEPENGTETANGPSNDGVFSHFFHRDLAKFPSHVKLLPFKRKASVPKNVEPLISEELSRPVIDISTLKKYSSLSILDNNKLRSTTWKILLGYLPLNRDDWKKEVDHKKEEYSVFKNELLTNPTEVSRRKDETEKDRALSNAEDELNISRLSNDDHPLSLGASSIWNQFFQDLELKEQIDRDVKRTHPDLLFFNNESDPNSLQIQESMKRILFLFAKLNSGIKYVQGMNELLAPLIFVFYEDDRSSLEEDSFFCLVSLLSDFRDNFCKQLDSTSIGIKAQIERLDSILKSCDYELWIHLKEKVKIDPQLFSFRWISLLLTQEFGLDSILKIWDFLLACDDRQTMLLKICVSMLLCIREPLLNGDFSSNIKLLQNYPQKSITIECLLQIAERVIA